MAGSLRRYWQARGSRTEGRVWLDRCLALSNERTRGRALALLEAGVLARTQFFSLDDAKELLRESLSIWRELGDQEFTAEALCMLGQATYAREPAAIAEARGYLEESLAICRARGDDYDAVVPLQSLATIAEREGRTQDAQAMLRDVVQALRGRGPDRRLAVVIHALAMHEAGLRNWGSARDHAEEAIAIAEAMSDTYLVGMVSTRLIEILANLGEIDRAREVFDLVDALIDTFEDVWDKGMITAHAGRAARLLDPARARALFVESNRLCRQMEQPFGVAGTVSELCGFELAFGETELARAYFTELVALYEDLQMDAAAVGELAIIAYFAYLLGEIETARQLLHRSLRATHQTSYPYGVALSADGLAMVAAAQQRWERAVVLFGASDAIHERIGQPHPGPDFHAEGVVQDQRQREYDRLVAEAEQTLGPRTFAEAWDAGRAMSIDEAVAYGLDDADDDG